MRIWCSCIRCRPAAPATAMASKPHAWPAFQARGATGPSGAGSVGGLKPQANGKARIRLPISRASRPWLSRIALDARPLQRLLHRVGVNTPKITGTDVSRATATAPLPAQHHRIEMGRVAADHRPQGDQHLVLTGAGHLLGHDRQFERSRHPGHQLGAGLRHIHAVAPGQSRQPLSSLAVTRSLKRATTIPTRSPAASKRPSNVAIGKVPTELSHRGTRRVLPEAELRRRRSSHPSSAAPAPPTTLPSRIRRLERPLSSLEAYSTHGNDQSKRCHHQGQNGQRVDERMELEVGVQIFHVDRWLWGVAATLHL